jgi:hypothetical protein
MNYLGESIVDLSNVSDPQVAVNSAAIALLQLSETAHDLRITTNTNNINQNSLAIADNTGNIAAIRSADAYARFGMNVDANSPFTQLQIPSIGTSGVRQPLFEAGIGNRFLPSNNVGWILKNDIELGFLDFVPGVTMPYLISHNPVDRSGVVTYRILFNASIVLSGLGVSDVGFMELGVSVLVQTLGSGPVFTPITAQKSINFANNALSIEQEYTFDIDWTTHLASDVAYFIPTIGYNGAGSSLDVFSVSDFDGTNKNRLEVQVLQ